MSRSLIAILLLVSALAWVGLLSLFQLAGGPGKSIAAPDGSQAMVKYVDQSRFHKDDAGEITLRLEIVKRDGEPVTNLPLKPETVKVVEQDEPAKVLEFNGPGQQGINLLLVIDHSGSMTGDKMQAARDAAVAALDELVVGRDSICVIAFDDLVDVVFPFERDASGEVARLTDESKRRCREQIQRIDIRGGTIIAAPTLTALDLFKQFAPSGAKLLMVMTDGEDETLPGQIGTITAESKEAGVPVFTIGFGGDVGGAKGLLRDISQRTSAKYLDAPTADELQRLYPAQVQAATKEFSIKYQSPFPEADGQTRDVRVEIGDNLIATAQYQTKGIIAGGSRKVAASGRATSGAGFKVFIFFVLMLALNGALFFPLLIRGGSVAVVEGPMGPPSAGPMRGSTIRSPPPPGARSPLVRHGPRPPSPPPVPGAAPRLASGRAISATNENAPPPMPSVAPSPATTIPTIRPPSLPPLAPLTVAPATTPQHTPAAGGNLLAAPPPPRTASASPLSAKPASGSRAAPAAKPPSVSPTTAAAPPPVSPSPPPPKPPAVDATGKKRTIRPLAPPPPPASS